MSEKETDGWSGSELRTVCRLAYIRKETLQDTKRYVRPVSAVMDTQIDSLRKWAMNGQEWTDKSRCIPATTPVEKVKRSVANGKRLIDISGPTSN